jgi:hypothetical protein
VLRKLSAELAYHLWTATLVYYGLDGAVGSLLGTIEAPDPDAAEAEAVKLFGLSEDQRKRLLVMWERE